MKLSFALIFSLILMLTSNVLAAQQEIKTWKSIDDQTNKAKSLVRIYIRKGILNGKVTKLFDKSYGNAPICTPCTDDRKDKPVIGMTVLRNFKLDRTEGWWKGGTVLDPENGNIYNAQLRVIENGKKLELRGYWGPFYRTQIWLTHK